MSRPAAAAGSAIDREIAAAALGAGRRAFPQAVLAAVRRVAPVDHCMVFAFAGERRTSCLMDVGTIGSGADLGEAYSDHFFRDDPNREVILGGKRGTAPTILPRFARRRYGDGYRRLFFDSAGIVDKLASSVWSGQTGIYLNLYRVGGSGSFGRDETAALRRTLPDLCGVVARYFERVESRCPISADDRLDELFGVNGPYAILTEREREVCRGILAGYSSEAIAGRIGISLHSALTYRRRAYEKLGISAQNELFRIALGALACGRKGGGQTGG